ncbi:MAG: hypothetical protein F4236_04745 [Acidimicrobiia bacterium]|nr:hypothetical protein [Acidimicrobiia bacterium]MYE67474.1 hypothetical protein [Acidimicrobiia bacterium]
MTVILDPRAEEFRRLDEPDELKPVEALEINVSILNSRWASMTRIAEIMDEQLLAHPRIGRVRHWRIKHSEPTPPEVLDEVTDSSHYAVLGLGN